MILSHDWEIKTVKKLHIRNLFPFADPGHPVLGGHFYYFLVHPVAVPLWEYGQIQTHRLASLCFITWKHTTLWFFFFPDTTSWSKCVVFFWYQICVIFPHQYSNSVTSAGCQFNSISRYLEVASDPTNQGLIPMRPTPFQIPAQEGSPGDPHFCPADYNLPVLTTFASSSGLITH